MPSFHWYLYAANHRNIDMVNYTAESVGIEQKMTSDNPSSCHLPLLKYIYIHRTYVQHTNIYILYYITVGKLVGDYWSLVAAISRKLQQLSYLEVGLAARCRKSVRRNMWRWGIRKQWQWDLGELSAGWSNIRQTCLGHSALSTHDPTHRNDFPKWIVSSNGH